MFVEVQDPHPGRCKNYRAAKDAYGCPTSKRCLDYEGRPHICQFDPDPPRQTSQAPNINTYRPEPPKPWVKPGTSGGTHE